MAPFLNEQLPRLLLSIPSIHSPENKSLCTSNICVYKYVSNFVYLNCSQWAETALARLVDDADKYVALDAGIRGTSRGPWSVADKESTPPSGDKRDFQALRSYGEMTRAIFPCFPSVCVR